MRKRKKEQGASQEVTVESETRVESDLPGDETLDEDEVPGVDGESAGAPESESHVALVETPEATIQKLSDEIAEQKERYLRLAAEFDNFRKRVERQRNEIRQKARSEIVRAILDTLDNLARVTALDTTDASVSDVIAGVEMVERSLLRELEAVGLAKVGNVGERFDPNDHDAVSTAATEDEEQVDLVAAVFQVGYRFGGILIRPARVQVYVPPLVDEDSGE